MSSLIIAVIALALFASFLTGVHDSSNVATMISSRAMGARAALSLAAVGEFVGPLIFGVQVANTIGQDVVQASTININVLIAGLASAILWILLTWMLGIPSSYSHALVGGFVGSVVVAAGWQAIQLRGFITIMVFLFIAPIIGFVAGLLILRLVLMLSWNSSPRVNNFFKYSQVISVFSLATSQGANDSSKSMGIITLALLIEGYLKSFTVPVWVVIICSGALALGTWMGGMRLIRTVGGKIYKIRPVDGFASQAASALIIIGASLLGGPVSTTQVVSSTVMGVGAAERPNKVRWSIGREIAISWLLTIPSTALIAAGFYWLFIRVIP
jgi:PiT family inorganic phosphate transporter